MAEAARKYDPSLNLREETKWKPGQSGNPGGIPLAVADARAKLRAAFPEAVELLLDLARNARSEKVKLEAIVTIIERVAGKPLQPLANVEPGSEIRYDAKVLLEKLYAMTSAEKK